MSAVCGSSSAPGTSSGRSGVIGSTSMSRHSPDRALGVLVLALSVVDVRQLARAVEQVAARPAAVAVLPPCLEVGIEQHRVRDLEALHRARNGVAVAPERVARRVHADHAQAGVRIARVPLLQVGERAQRVDAREVPELDQDRPSAHERVHAQEGHIEPFDSLRNSGA